MNTPNNPQPTLKQVSQDHFAKQSLSEDRLSRFEALMAAATAPASEAVEPAATSGVKNDKPALETVDRSTFYRVALAASLTGLLLLGGSLLKTGTLLPSGLNNPQYNQQNMIAAIADEVTKNHIKLKPLEVSSDDFDSVRRYFTQLDFSPQPSRRFGQNSPQPLTMAGGRYCSIQSVTAAQLRYQVAPGRWSTLYQTQYLADTFGPLPQLENGQAPLETFSRGLKVNIWVERQLLMVSVEDARLEND